MLDIVTAPAWRRQVQASFFCFYHACVIAVSDLGTPQRVRRKQFHHGQLSMQCFFLSKYASTPVTTFVYLQDVSRGYNASVTDVPQRSTIDNLRVIPSSLINLAAVHKAMTWSCAVATALNQEHVIITVDQARQSTAKHKKFVGSIHASSKMSRSGWVPSTQLPPSWRFLASLLVMLVCKMIH